MTNRAKAVTPVAPVTPAGSVKGTSPSHNITYPCGQKISVLTPNFNLERAGGKTETPVQYPDNIPVPGAHICREKLNQTYNFGTQFFISRKAGNIIKVLSG